jgi:hypothetical protein
MLVERLTPGEQRALGELRESEALLSRLIGATAERGSRGSADRQRERLRQVGVKT